MELNLYVVNDSDNVINKNMVNKVTININLKRDIDISNPSLILLDVQGVNYSDFNYAEISELGRFYFINNVQRLNHKMIQVDLVCDVLETYKSDVLNSLTRYKRNVEAGDYLDVPLESSIKTTSIKYDSSVSFGDVRSTILSSLGV